MSSALGAIQFEEVIGTDVLSRERSAGDGDSSDAPFRKNDSARANFEEVLSAVTRFARQLRRLDSSGSHEALQECDCRGRLLAASRLAAILHIRQHSRLRGWVSTLLLFAYPERGRLAMTLPATKSPYPYANSIGPQVKAERTKRKLSDNKLAKLAHVSRRHLVELMKGANVTLNIAEKVMEALELEELVFPGGERRLRLPPDRADATIQRQEIEAAAKQLETGVALILRAASAFRRTAPRTASEPKAFGAELATKAANLIDDFGAYVRSLDSEDQVDTLQWFTSSFLIPSAATKKRKAKTA